MRLPGGFCLSTGAQGFPSILTDRLQYHEAWFLSLLSRLQQQVLTQEGSQPVHHRWQHVPKCGRDGLGCRERTATHEDREAPEEALFVWREQVVAPLDGTAQGLLPSRYIPSRAGQQGQALPQTSQERLWWEQPEA